jgi:hypothetical protein
MTTAERIERKAKKAGMDITIDRANNWIGSAGKGKWAYSQFVPGRGIYEPEKAFPNLAELEYAIDQNISMMQNH